MSYYEDGDDVDVRVRSGRRGDRQAYFEDESPGESVHQPPERSSSRERRRERRRDGSRSRSPPPSPRYRTGDESAREIPGAEPRRVIYRERGREDEPWPSDPDIDRRSWVPPSLPPSPDAKEREWEAREGMRRAIRARLHADSPRPVPRPSPFEPERRSYYRDEPRRAHPVIVDNRIYNDSEPSDDGQDARRDRRPQYHVREDSQRAPRASPVIINNRVYNDDASDDGHYVHRERRPQYHSRDESQQAPPIIINNRIYNDNDSSDDGHDVRRHRRPQYHFRQLGDELSELDRMLEEEDAAERRHDDLISSRGRLNDETMEARQDAKTRYAAQHIELTRRLEELGTEHQARSELLDTRLLRIEMEMEEILAHPEEDQPDAEEQDDLSESSPAERLGRLQGEKMRLNATRDEASEQAHKTLRSTEEEIWQANLKRQKQESEIERQTRNWLENAELDAYLRERREERRQEIRQIRQQILQELHSERTDLTEHHSRTQREVISTRYTHDQQEGIMEDFGDSEDDTDAYFLSIKEVEKEGLSFTLPINTINQEMLTMDSQDGQAPTGSDAQAWKQPKTTLLGDLSTELLVIHALEHSVDERGQQKTTLVPPVGPMRENADSAPQMRWLHIQQPSLELKALSKLILCCPYISKDLIAVAITVMDKVKTKFSSTSECGPYLEPGSVMRYIGRYNGPSPDDRADTEPVVFLSTPYLDLQPSRRSSTADTYSPRTILQSLYGYDVGSERESSQVVQKMNAASKKRVLHVNQLWCLLIGSSILITMSDQPAKEIRGHSIMTNSRMSGNSAPLTIRLIDDKHRQYPVAIESDYNFVDFLRYAVNLVKGNESDVSEYELLDQEKEALTPDRWIQILTSSTSRSHTFSVNQKRRPWKYSYEVPEPPSVDNSRVDVISRRERERTRSNYDQSPNRHLVSVRRDTASKSRRPRRESVYREHLGPESGVVPYGSPPEYRQPSTRPPLQRLIRVRERESTSRIDAEEPSTRPNAPTRELSAQVPDQDVSLPEQPQSPVVGKEDDSGPYVETKSLRSDNGRSSPETLRGVSKGDQIEPSGSALMYRLAASDDEDDAARQVSSVVRTRPAPLPDSKNDIPPRAIRRERDIDLSERDSRHTRVVIRPGTSPTAMYMSPAPMSTAVTKYHSQNVGGSHGRKESLRDRRTEMDNPASHPNSKALVRRPMHRFSSAGPTRRSTGLTRQSTGPTRRSTFDRSRNHGASTSTALVPYARAKSKTISLVLGDGLLPGQITNEMPFIKRASPELFDTSSKTTGSDEDVSDDSNSSDRIPWQIIRGKSFQGTPTRSRSATMLYERETKARSGTLETVREQHRFRSRGLGSRSPSLLRTKREVEFDIGRERHIRPGDSPEDSKTLEIGFVPFFTWRSKKNEKSERTPQEVEEALVAILSRLQKSLSSADVNRLYARTFSCSMKHLSQRHNLPELPSCEPPILSTANGTATENEGKAQMTASDGHSTEVQTPSSGKKSDQDTFAADLKPSEPQTDPGQMQDKTGIAVPKDSDNADSRQARYLQAPSHHQELMKQLMQVSQRILWAFVPEGSPLIHNVPLRFWGCVDAIFRQMTWQATNFGPPENHEYVIRDFDIPSKVVGEASPLSHSQKRLWRSCADCHSQSGSPDAANAQPQKHYRSATEALEHLHKEHMVCSGKTERPSDDPCFVWLRRVQPNDLNSQDPGYGISKHVEDFIEVLLPISHYVRELHNLVATAQDSTSQTRPPLPSSLVYAFGQIMTMYLLRAYWLSLYNRRFIMPTEDNGYSRTESLELKVELRRREDAAMHKSHDFLQDAKKDIILLQSTSRQINSLGMESVGAEFLAMALIVNLQNRSILAKPTPTTLQKADFIELYQNYTSRLRFQANRRPQKRVFLDIHSLEEELDALHSTLEAQSSVLSKYLKLLSPGSTRTTSATRVGQYKVEKGYARIQQKTLRSKESDIGILKEKSQALKLQVKQTIEILEEDHGKAIRVFTIVTLFFLPLSFVSSFMGMNTKDVRSMEFSQQVFWMTGVPVTLTVMVIALVYGYKGDEIGDWFAEKMYARRRRAGQAASGGVDAAASAAATDEKRRLLHVDTDMSYSRGDQKDVRTRITEALALRQRKKGLSKMKRRQTGDSVGF